MSLDKKSLLSVVSFLSIILVSQAAFAAQMSAVTNKIIYVTGDTLTITGKLMVTESVKTVRATIYNSTASLMNFTSTSSSGGTTNTFSISNVINSSYNPGDYWITLKQGTDYANMSIKVVTKLIYLEPHFINSTGDVINITTDMTVDSSNETSFLPGGNLTDIVDLSLSGVVHYGNYSIGSKIYHFVLVDQTNTSNYDRLYVDDDPAFRLLNDTEDTGTSSDIEYQELKEGGLFSNNSFKYIVAEIERTTGTKIILFKHAIGKPPYDASDTINFVLIAKNSTHLVPNVDINVDVRNSTTNVTPLTTHQTNQFGWFNASKSFSNLRAGFYVLDFNDSLNVLPFPVEVFKLFVSTTDLSGSPTSVFAPNSKVRILATSKNTTDSITLSSFTATINCPNGSIATKSQSDFEEVATGVYRYDLDLTAAPAGSYGIAVVGTSGGDIQKSSAAFDVKSVNFEAEAINHKYIEEAESSGAMVNAFAPHSNVSIMTFLSNISAGGMGVKGPEGFVGLLDPGDCNSSVTLTELKDENGVSYMDTINYKVMNLSEALNYFGETPTEPPPVQMEGQCMVIFVTPNKTGIYRAEVQIDYQGEEIHSGVMFGVQRLFARGATVDAKGDDFGFFAPNTSIRIKLKVRDLVTDEELPGNNISSGKIIELFRVYPTFKDVLRNSTLRTNLNENIIDGTINFTSPPDEGFYMMKFRFTADLGGQTVTGIGDAFFMLKKYMIWAEPAGSDKGQWYVGQGENISLSVTVLDIDKAQSVFGGYTKQKSCTGCSNFTINISEIRNEQQFKKIPRNEYTVQEGYITNSSNPVATVTIAPSGDMQTGWYSVDLIVNDIGTDATYFGWGGFEIRNFWVETRKASYNVTADLYTYLEERDEGPMFPVDSTIYFVVLPRNASNPSQLLIPDTISLESLSSFEGWPPLPLSDNEYTSSVSNESIQLCMEEEDPQSCVSQGKKYIVNISSLPSKETDYQANVKVVVGSLSDVGSFWFSVASYKIEVDYRIRTWPPTFASTENLIVNFTALDFNQQPVNISNVTIDELFSIKKGRPIKMKYGQNYTSICQDNFCQSNVTLSNLLTGEYVVRFSVEDEDGDEKEQEVFFKVQDMIISIATLEEAWIHETGTVSKKVDNDVRKGQWTWCGNERNSIPNASKFCGDFCGAGPCQQFNLTAPNVSFSKELFGYIPLMEDHMIGRFGSIANKSRMWIYANGSQLWINATPDMTGPNLADLRNTSPIAINDYFFDSEGGKWKLVDIGEQSITIKGINTLYQTGVLINTSYSKSGVIKLGQIEESRLGAFTPQGRTGVDLDNDGFKNETAYFAITDNASSGLYDMFFFSTDGNFTGSASPLATNPIYVNDPNRENRIFSFGENLTLLSIDTRAHSIRFYSEYVGDWADLGDIKQNNNITIPILVTAPSGVQKSANISITGYKNMKTWAFTSQNLVTDQNVTRIGELRFNSSNLGSTGKYAFAVEAADEPIEEWKWPIATVRGFLLDGELGEAFYLNDFKALDIREYKWDTPGVKITRIQRDARNSTPGYIIDGVIGDVYEVDLSNQGCSVLNATANITDEIYQQLSIYGFMWHETENHGYFFYNSTSGVLYRNTTGCCFNLSASLTTYQKGSYINISRDGKSYNTTILTIDRDMYNYDNQTDSDIYFENTSDCHNFGQPVIAIFNVSNTSHTVPASAYNWTSAAICINSTDWVDDTYNISYQWRGRSWRTDFGVAGINASILPMVDNPYAHPDWRIEWGYMQNVSIFGTYYDVILANDTTYNYQRCILESPSDGQCAKKAWFVATTVGNFSDSSVEDVTIGENFTSDLYLAAIGPHDGDGITVGNFSNLVSLNLPQLPGIGGMPLADNTTTYFLVLNESELNVDLDKNSTNTTFYMLVFDSDFDGVQNVTSNIIDDDLEMVDWSTNSEGTQTQIDFSSNESFQGADANWTKENWCDLPTGISDGCARFGEQYPNKDWEYQPDWQVPFYNTTHMLLRKDRHTMNKTQEVSVLIKVYDFDQTPIQGANVSVIKMAVGIPWLGFQTLTKGDNYTVNTTYNVTDSYGYSLLKINPNPSGNKQWSDGEHQVLVKVETPQGTENWERWFCVGGVCK